MSNARINLFWLIIFTLTLPLAVVLSTHLARKSFERVKLSGQTIRVKGYAERPIVSDRAEWSATIRERDADRTQAYLRLAEQRALFLRFLDARGVAAEQVVLSPVDIRVIYEKNDRGYATNTIEAYAVDQTFAIASDDVDRVAGISRDAGSLIGEGVELSSDSPRYLYTKLDDLKLAMIADATRNARDRAELLVAGSPNALGPLQSASQGVFQITPAFSNEVSGSGMNDTTSLHKVIKAVVTVEYGIAG